MPNYDETGPIGYGSRTGRGLGPCGLGVGYGRGYRREMGRGRFQGYFPYQRITRAEETEILEDEARDLEEEMQAIKQRLAELKAKK